MLRKPYILPLLVLSVVLAGQLAVSAAGVRAKLGGSTYHATMWPFVDYPMYSRSSGPPVTTSAVRLVATLANGSEVVVDTEFMGLNWFAWRDHVVERLVADPLPDPERDPALAALIEEHREEALERVWSQVVIATGEGPVDLMVYRTVYTLEGRRMVTSEVEQPVDLTARLRALDRAADEAVDGGGGGDGE